jgi:hypothetical protein
VENPSVKPLIDNPDVDIEERRHRNRARMMLNPAAPMTGGVHEFQSNRRRRFARADPALPQLQSRDPADGVAGRSASV